jgi:glycosyltransferase involved in cell wall biosynthesis
MSSMRKVVIDAHDFVGLRGGAGGSGSYFLSLVEQLARLVDVEVIASAGNSHFLRALAARSKRLVVAVNGGGHAEAIGASLKDAEILYAPFTALPERSAYRHIPAVTAIHDLQHRFLKSFFPEPERVERDDAYFAAVTDADAVLTFAQVERHNIMNFYNVHGKIGVVPHAPFLAEEIERDFGDAPLTPDRNPYTRKFGRYVLYPAVNWPHKNHYRLIEAFRFLCQELDVRNVKLVLTGASCVEQREHFYKGLLQQSWAQERIVNLGFVSSLQLYMLIKGAEALAFPSMYEGFGIPVLEAMRIGTPVIASDLAVMHEWFGECYEPFRNIRDSWAMAEDLRRLLDSPCRRRELSEKALERSHAFSSKRMAQETFQFLSEVADEFGRPKRHRGRPYRDMATLRRKSCRVLLHVLIDTLDPEIIRHAAAAAQAVAANATDDIRFLFIAPYSAKRDACGGVATKVRPTRKKPRKNHPLTELDIWFGQTQGRSDRTLLDELCSGIGEIVYFDDVDGAGDRSRAIRFYVATQIDASFHSFIKLSVLAELDPTSGLAERYHDAALRQDREIDGFYLGEHSWAALRSQILHVVHAAPRRLEEAVSDVAAMAIHNFVLTNDFVLNGDLARRSSPDWFGNAWLAELAIHGRIAEPRLRFAYIETELRHRVGHHFALVEGLCQAAAAAGLDPVVGANRDAGLGDGTTALTMDACFSGYAQAPEPYVTPSHFADELLAFLCRQQLGPHDYVYLHMPYPTLVAGVLQLVATSLVEKLPVFLIRICSADESFRWHDIRQTKLVRAIGELGAARRNRIRLFAESIPLQRYFERLAGQSLPVLLNPIGRTLAASALTAADLRQQRRRGGTVVFGYFGEARREKGFDLLPDIVENLIAIYGPARVKFAIQVSAAPDNDTEQVRTARRRLERLAEMHKADAAICLYEEFPDMRGYYRALAGCDALLLPYDVAAYQARGSGVALEGLALGIPIVVAAGTDMAVTFAGQGCITAASHTADAFAQACAFVVDNLPAIAAGVQDYLARSPLVQSESEYIRALVGHVPAIPAGVPEERPVAIWIGNDVLSQGCSAVYDAQRDFLRRHGFEIYNVYVPFPDLGGYRHSDEALEKYLVANALGWAANGYDFGCYSWILNQSDDASRPDLLDEIAKQGASTARLLALNAYSAFPASLLRLVEGRQVALVCLNYVHLLPVVEKLGLLHRKGTRVVLETHDIQADQHAIRSQRDVDEQDKELELRLLSDADAVVAISRGEYAEIGERNPWANVEFVLPTMRLRDALSHKWRPGASQLRPHWLEVWCERPELQTLFDLRTPSSLVGFLRWILLFGRREYPMLEVGPELIAIADAPHLDFPNGGESTKITTVVGWAWGARADLRELYPAATDPGHFDRQGLLKWLGDEGAQEYRLEADGSLTPSGSDRRGLPQVAPTLLEAFVLARPKRLATAEDRHRLFDWLSAAGRVDVILVGSDHPANIASIRRFIHEVHAAYLAPHGVNLLLVGRSGMALEPGDTVPGLFALGEVEVLDPLYRIASVVAVPTSVGTGTPIKVLDAFARGLCVSASNFVDRALDLRAYGFPMCAEPHEFAADIRELLSSQDARRERIALAQEFAADQLGAATYDTKWRALAGLAADRGVIGEMSTPGRELVVFEAAAVAA